MDQQVIDDLYNRAVSQGYKKSKDQFVNLLHSDNEVFNDMYSYVRSQGYRKSANDFSSLIGKTPATIEEPLKKKGELPEITQQEGLQGLVSPMQKGGTESISQDTSLGYTKPSEPQPAQQQAIPTAIAKPAPAKEYTAPVVEETITQLKKEGAKPAPPKDFFDKSLDIVNKDLIAGEEENAVPKLNYHFGDYGFTFEKADPLGDAMTVTAANGKKINVDLDPFFTSGSTQAEELKQFLKDNKLQSEKLQKESQGYERKMQKFFDEKEIKQTVKKFDDEINNFNQQGKDYLKAKALYDKMYPKYAAMTAEDLRDPAKKAEYDAFVQNTADLQKLETSLIKNQEGLGLKQKQLNKAVGAYTAAKAEEGDWGGFIVKKFLNATGDIAASGYANLIDLTRNVTPAEWQTSSWIYEDKFTKIAKEKGLTKPEGVSFDDWKKSINEDVKDEINSKIKDQLSKEAKKEALTPEMKTTFAELLGPSTTTQDFLAKKDEENWLYRVTGALAGSAASMIGPAPVRVASFFFQGQEAARQLMSTDAWKNTSENEKLGLSALMGTVSAVLEEFGIRNLVASKGLLNNVIAKALGQSVKGTSVKTFEEFIRQDVKSRIARGLLTVTAAGLAEGETGGAQEAFDEAIMYAYNQAKGKDMFVTPKSWGEYATNVLVAARDEAAGGVIMGTLPAIANAAYTHDFTKISKEQFDIFKYISKDPEYANMFKVNLEYKVSTGQITQKEAKEQLENYNKVVGAMYSVPDNLNIDQKKNALGIIMRKQQLEAEVEGKDPALVKKQTEEIAGLNKKLEEISKSAPEYTIDGVQYNKSKFLDKIAGMSLTQLLNSNLNINNDNHIVNHLIESLDAIQKPSTEEAMLQLEQFKLGLQKMGEGDTEVQAVAEEGGQVPTPKEGEVAPIKTAKDLAINLEPKNTKILKNVNGDKVYNYTNEDGVEVTLKEDEEGGYLNGNQVQGDVMLDFIGNDNKRNQGLATKELDRIISEADKNNMSVSLIVDSEQAIRGTESKKGLSNQELKKWYQSKGFIFDKDSRYGYRPKKNEDTSSYIKEKYIAKEGEITKNNLEYYSSPDDLQEAFDQDKLKENTFYEDGDGFVYKLENNKLKEVSNVKYIPYENNVFVDKIVYTEAKPAEAPALKEGEVTEPSEEQILDDIKNKRFVTFTYNDESEVPEQFKDKISSTGEINGKKVIRVTLPESVANYELAKAEGKTKTEGVTTTQKQPVTGIPPLAPTAQDEVAYSEGKLEKTKLQGILSHIAEKLNNQEDLTEFENKVATENNDSLLEMMQPAAEPKAGGISVSNKEAITSLKEKIKDAAKLRIVETAERAINTLKSVFPDFDIHIHDTEDSFISTMKQLGIEGKDRSGGVFSYRPEDGKFVGGRIDINLNKAGARTVAHEITHAVLLKTFGDNVQLFNKFKDNVSKLVSESRNKELAKFISQYADNENAEEYLSELTGYLNEEKDNLSPSLLQKFAILINNTVSKITGGRLTPFQNTADAKEIGDFLNTISQAVTKGEGIMLDGVSEKINPNAEPTGKEIDISTIKSKASLIQDLGLERFKDMDKRIKLGVTLKQIGDVISHLTFSDRLATGKVGNKDYLGGILFAAATNRVWASFSKGRVSSIISGMVKNEDGYRYLMPALLTESAHMSNKDMVNTAIMLVENSILNNKISPDIANQRIKKALSIKGLENFLEIYNQSIGKNKINADVVKTAIDNAIVKSNTTFEQRKSFLESLLGKADINIKKRFGDINSFNELANGLAEPITNGHDFGDILLTIRTKGDLIAVQPKEGDPDYHPSYPWVIRAVNPDGTIADVETLIFQKSYNAVDVFPEVKNKQGKTVTYKDYQEKYGDRAKSQYLGYIGARSAMSTSVSEKIKTKAKSKEEVKTEQPTVTSKAQRAAVEETANKLEPKISPKKSSIGVQLRRLTNLITHNGPEVITKLDPSRIKGFMSGRYGKGFYFSNLFKNFDYGDKSTYLDTNSLKFMNGNMPAAQVLNTLILPSQIRSEIYKLDRSLLNAKNVREYDAISKEIDDLKKIESTFDDNSKYIEKALQDAVKENPKEHFASILENLEARVIRSNNLNKMRAVQGLNDSINNLLLQSGFDGVNVDDGREILVIPQEKLNDLIVPSQEKFIAEAYHKAKEDGSNPELVKAVEEAIGKPTEAPAPKEGEVTKERNEDLFPETTSFANIIGDSGSDSKISSYTEKDGVGVASYTNPENGLVDVIMSGTSDNDFVGYIRIYENGKPTNRFTSKMANESGNKQNFKTMLSEVQKLLPKEHEYTETTNISLEGLKIYADQLKRGYQIAKDKDGNIITKDVNINKASKEALKKAQTQYMKDVLYTDIRVKDNDQFEEIKKQVESIMPESNVKLNENNTVTIKLPVLKQQPTVTSKAQIDAWHGSPHKVEKFSTEKIGTGEGAQAFGWGLYFTDLKSIAEGYAKKLVPKALEEYIGKYYKDGTDVAEKISDFIKSGGSFEEWIKEREKLLERRKAEKEKGADWKGTTLQNVIPNLEFQIKSAKELNEKVDKNLYNVTLHEGKTPDQYTWLEWDKPVSEEMINKIIDNDIDGTIQEALTYYYGERADYDISTVKDLKNILEEDELTGRELYNIISKNTTDATPKSASIALLNAGVDGIKYPAESLSRGATSETARGFNYVVFDENAVTIKTVSKAQRVQVDNIEGYERMQGIIDDIIEKSKQRGNTVKETLQNVLSYLTERSKVYDRADDSQREQLVRDVYKKLGMRVKSTAPVGKILGHVNNVKSMTMTDKMLFDENLKSYNRGAKDMLSSFNKARKAIVTELKELVNSGKITLKQATSILDRFAKVDMFNDDSIAKFVSYTDRVFKDAQFAEKLASVKKKLKRAKENIKSKIGSQPQLHPLLNTLFNINPELIPAQVFDTYTNLVEMFGERAAVLTLQKDIDSVLKDAYDVLDAVNAEQSVVEELSDVFDAYQNKVFNNDGKLNFAETLKRMLKDGVISEEDLDLMKKYKADIVERLQPEPMTEEELAEEKEQLIEAANDIPIKTGQLEMEDEIDLVEQLKSLMTNDILSQLTNQQLKDLLKTINNINNGYVTAYANIIKDKMESIKNGIDAKESVQGAKVLPLTKALAKIKALFNNKQAYDDMVKEGKLFYLDQLLGDFKSKKLFNALFKKIAQQQAKFESQMKQINAKLDEANVKIANSFNKNPNKITMSKYKIMTYLLQKEFEANPGNKQVNPASKFLKATIDLIDGGNSNYSDKDAEMLQEILDSYSTDGEIDINKLYNSFNQAEKDGIKTIQNINKSLLDKALFTAAVIRGQKINPIKDYIHLNTIRESNVNEISPEQSLIQAFNNAMKPSTKSKTLIERTGDVSALNFDPFVSVNKGAKSLLMDYYLTSPIRTARGALAYMDKAMAEEGRLPKETRDLKNAIKNAFEESISNFLTNTYENTTFVDSVIQAINRIGYKTILASTTRFVAELKSNISGAMIYAPKAFMTGVAKYKNLSMSKDGLDFMNNIGSVMTNRLYASNTLSNKFIDSTIMDQALGTKGSQAKNEVANIMQVIYNNSLKHVANFADVTSDALVSTPDKVVMRPTYFGVFANEFKRLTGEEMDERKISSNDKEYMSKHKEAIEKAKDLADQTAVFIGNSENPFLGTLKGKGKITDAPWKKAFNNFNSFMVSYSINEYVTARTAIYAMVGKGMITKDQGARLLASVVVRNMVYTTLAKTLGSALVGLFVDEDDEDEKSLLETIMQSLASTMSSLLLGRDFGNAARSMIGYGVEEVNKNYLDFLRDGEYDPYKDAIMFSTIPLDEKQSNKGAFNMIANMAGGYAPAMKTANLIFNKLTEKEKQTIEAQDRVNKEKTIRIPLEIAGNAGFIPFYKDIRRVVNADLYKDLKNETSGGRQTYSQSQTSQEDLKKYYPEIYKQYYGENSPYKKIEKEYRDIEKKYK